MRLVVRPLVFVKFVFCVLCRTSVFLMGLKWSYCLRHGRLRVTWREVKEGRGLREGREREGGSEGVSE